MRETVEKSDKRPHCFELYGAGSDIIKACKVDKEGKVVEGKLQRFTSSMFVSHFHGVQSRMISVDNFFVFLRLLFFALLLPSAQCGNYISPSLCANSIWKSFLKYE